MLLIRLIWLRGEYLIDPVGICFSAYSVGGWRYDDSFHIKTLVARVGGYYLIECFNVFFVFFHLCFFSVRQIAEDGLKSLTTPEALDVLFLGYVFTKDDSLRQILNDLGLDVPETTELPVSDSSEPVPAFSPAEKVWQFQNSKDETILTFHF